MNIAIIVYSIVVGALIGFFYGYSFVLQQKSIFSIKNQLLLSIAISTIRIFLTGIVFILLLHTQQINPILVTVTLIVIFWIIILIEKASLYAGS